MIIVAMKTIVSRDLSREKRVMRDIRRILYALKKYYYDYANLSYCFRVAFLFTFPSASPSVHLQESLRRLRR